MKLKLAALLVLTGLTGCAAERELDPFDTLSHRNAVDPERETKTKRYQSVLAGYHPRTVVEPKPWTNSASEPEDAGASEQ